MRFKGYEQLHLLTMTDWNDAQQTLAQQTLGILTHISITSFLLDVGKQCRPRADTE